MGTLVTQTINRTTAGTTISAVAAGTTSGDLIATGAGMMLEVINGSAVSSTVTLAIPASRVWEAGVALTSPAISVQAGQTRWIGTIDSQTFMDPTTGLCAVTYSSAATVTVAAVQLLP